MSQSYEWLKFTDSTYLLTYHNLITAVDVLFPFPVETEKLVFCFYVFNMSYVLAFWMHTNQTSIVPIEAIGDTRMHTDPERNAGYQGQ